MVFGPDGDTLASRTRMEENAIASAPRTAIARGCSVRRCSEVGVCVAAIVGAATLEGF